MNIWSILGIAPTNDTAAIKKAYRAKLAVTHPEEKPEEFKALREAYEQALKLAAETEKEADSSVSGQWTAKAAAIYGDFARRINPAEWKALLQDDFAFSLATRPQAQDALLSFFMEKYYLPHECWLVLDDFFALSGQKEQLAQQYPQGFLDNVVYSGIDYPDYVRYEYFNECHATEPDDFLRQYFKAERLIREGNIDEGEKELDTLENLPAKHPFSQLLRIRVLLQKEQYDRALQKAEELLAPYQENDTLQVLAGDCARAAANFQQAIPHYAAVLAQNENNFAARNGRAICLCALGNWKDAVEDYDFLLKRYPSDYNLRQRQKDAYTQWAEFLQQQPHPLTNRQTLDLVWAQIETDDHEEALQRLLEMQADNIDEEYEKQNSAGNLCLALRRYEDALHHAQEWEKTILAIPADTTDPEQKRRITRLPRSYEMQAEVLYRMGETQKAHQKMQQAAELTPDEPRIWQSLAEWNTKEQQFQKAAECAEKVCQLLPNDAMGYWLLAMAHYDMVNYTEAYQALEKAIDKEGTNLSYYVFQFRILCARQKPEIATQLLEYLEKRNAPADDLAFLKARWMQIFGDKQQEAAAEKEILAILEDPKLGYSCMDLLYYAASFCDALSRQQQFELIQKGLEYRNPDIDLLCRGTWLANEIEYFDVAIEYGEKSLQLYPFVLNQKYRLAYAYSKRNRRLESAKIYAATGESENDPEDTYLAGLHYYYGGDFEKSRVYLEKAGEMDPKNHFVHRILALHERDAGNQQACLAHMQKAIDLVNQSEDNDRKKQRQSAQYQMMYQLLSHFGRTEEAFAAALEYARIEGELYAYAEADELRENAQQWNKAFAARSEYFQTHNTPEDKRRAAVQQGFLLLRQGEVKKAEAVCKKLWLHEQTEGYLKLKAFCLLAQCDNKGAYKVWKKIPEKDAFLRQNVYFLWMLHDLGKKDELAKILEQKQLRIESWDTGGEQRVYDTVACNILLFMGEIEKADALLAQSEAQPLCCHCEYDICKDALETRAIRHELLGELEQALAIWQEMYRKYASDETIALHTARLQSKMAQRGNG